MTPEDQQETAKLAQYYSQYYARYYARFYALRFALPCVVFCALAWLGPCLGLSLAETRLLAGSLLTVLLFNQICLRLVRRLSPHLTNERFRVAYGEYRWAFIAALAIWITRLILGLLFLNGGGAFGYLYSSVLFWLAAAYLFFARAHPTAPERIALAAGPAALFLLCWQLSAYYS